MHVHPLGLGAAVVMAVSEGPSDQEIALAKWAGQISGSSLGTFAGISRRRRRRQGGRALGDHWRQAGRVGHWRFGVMHVHRLGLGAAVVMAVGEGPSDQEIALAKWAGDIGSS